MSPKVLTPVVDAEQTDASIKRAAPPELKIELRRLMTAILVADFRASRDKAQGAETPTPALPFGDPAPPAPDRAAR